MIQKVDSVHLDISYVEEMFWHSSKLDWDWMTEDASYTFTLPSFWYKFVLVSSDQSIFSDRLF